jgi:hypothetical protein
MTLDIADISRDLAECDALFFHEGEWDITPICPDRIVRLRLRDSREELSVEYCETLSLIVEVVISILRSSEPIWVIYELHIVHSSSRLGIANIRSDICDARIL